MHEQQHKVNNFKDIPNTPAIIAWMSVASSQLVSAAFASSNVHTNNFARERTMNTVKKALYVKSKRRNDRRPSQYPKLLLLMKLTFQRNILTILSDSFVMLNYYSQIYVA